MTVKISAKKELGISKLILVKESNKNYRKTLKFQKDILRFQIEQTKAERAEKEKQEARDAALLAGEKINEVDELKELEGYENQIEKLNELQDNSIAYVSEILGLSDKYIEKLDDLEFSELQEFATNIAAKIMGMEPQEATAEDKGLED